MAKQKKRAKARKKKSWLDPVAGATDEEYREMERRVFNARNLLPKVTLLDLRLMRSARAGSPTSQFVTSWDDPLVPDKARTGDLGWADTPYEQQLRQISIEGASEADNQCLWDLIYGLLNRIVRDTFELSENDGWKWLEGTASERKVILDNRAERNEKAKKTAEKYGLLDTAHSKPLLVSREASKKFSIARRMHKLASDVERFAPVFAEQCLRPASRMFAQDAAQLGRLAREKKRNPQNSKTWRIGELMGMVSNTTGKQYTNEINKLLQLAGIHYGTPEDPTGTLRTLRSRNKSRSKPS